MSDFWKIKCKDCETVMIVFSHAARDLYCPKTKKLLAQATGGKLRLVNAEIIEVYD